MPDTEEDPITFDLASEEVIAADNDAEKKDMEALRKA